MGSSHRRNLIWFGHIARLFQWGAGVYFTRSNDFYLTLLRLGEGGISTLWNYNCPLPFLFAVQYIIHCKIHWEDLTRPLFLPSVAHTVRQLNESHRRKRRIRAFFQAGEYSLSSLPCNLHTFQARGGPAVNQYP
jgi:hypothetical protein